MMRITRTAHGRKLKSVDGCSVLPARSAQNLGSASGRHFSFLNPVMADGKSATTLAGVALRLSSNSVETV
jgi:hypothetical protein